jgi:hypothetical protein
MLSISLRDDVSLAALVDDTDEKDAVTGPTVATNGNRLELVLQHTFVP